MIRIFFLLSSGKALVSSPMYRVILPHICTAYLHALGSYELLGGNRKTYGEPHHTARYTAMEV